MNGLRLACGVLLCACLSARPGLAQSDGMILVDGQTFDMGTDPASVDALMTLFGAKRRELFTAESPAHRAAVEDFFFDATEVTNAAFAGFVRSHGQWADARRTSDPRLPVTFVSWNAASAYCAWVGKRLPGEAEWELAAGRGDGRQFPWGDAMPDAARANWSGSGIGAPAPVGSYPPAGNGLYDLAGNVWEFVQDAWRDRYDAPASLTERRVIRGGSYGGAAVNLRVRYRDSHPADAPGPHVGFRCARSVR